MVKRLPFFNRLSTSQKKVIEKNYSFYRKLKTSQKNKFHYRVSRFISKYEFISRENVRIDKNVKAIIAAVAIMLTFKKKNYLLEPFNKIIIYSNSFKSNSTGNMHKGETNPKLGIIVFSLPDFLNGIIIDDDNLNLGIHEFTHAFLFSNFKANSFESKRFKSGVNNIFNYFIDDQKIEETKKANIFREYAYVNKHEFLSVITENYFENPQTFQQKLPLLFSLVNDLYNTY